MARLVIIIIIIIISKVIIIISKIIIIIIISKISIIIINSYLQDKDSKNGNFQLLRRWRTLFFTSNNIIMI
jgi:hypothetical protein